MRRTFKGMSLDEALREVEERPFHLVPGLIDGRATMLVGQSESGKTTLVVDLIAAALSGEPFLGRELTRPVGRVVILSPEIGGTGEYAQRLTDRGLAREMATQRLVLHADVVALSAEDWKALADEVKPTQGDLVIVDPLVLILPEGASLNSDESVRSLWSCLGKWVSSGAAILIVHHSTRKRSQGGYQAEDGLGSSFFQAAARLTLTLRRGRDGRILKTSPNTSPSEILTLSGTGGTGFQLVSVSDGETTANVRRAERDNKQATRLVDAARWAISNHPTATKAELSRALAGQFAWLAGGRNPDREIAKHLSDGRKIGAFLDLDDSGRWCLTGR